MFLILDESEEHQKMVLGGLLISEKILPDFESDFVKLRIKHKLFGELKWSRIDQYYERYCDFINLFFNEKSITFHSICYRRGGTDKYRAGYSLIRTITWKLQNAGIKEPLYVLFDNDGNLGDKEAREIRKIAQKDHRFKQELEFCSQGTSHLLGAMQISDLITGAVCSTINSISSSTNKKKVLDYIFEKNDRIALDQAKTSLALPKLSDFKIHFFDPDDKLKM